MQPPQHPPERAVAPCPVVRPARDPALLDHLYTTLARQLDEREIVRTVVAALAEGLGYARLSVGLLQDEQFVGESHLGLAHRPSTFPLGAGMMGRVARSRRAELVTDIANDPDFIGERAGTTGAICVPLLDGDDLLGVLNVESTGDDWLGEDDLHLLSALAVQVGIALGRARRHAALRQSAARLRTQYAAFPLPTYTWEHRDGDFVFIDRNAAADAFSHGTVAALLGQPASVIYHDRPVVREHLARCFAERTLLQHELRLHDPIIGADRDVIVTYSYVAPDLVVMHSEEETARKAAEAALRASEARYRALVQHARDVTMIVGADGQLLYTSPAIERTLGYSRDGQEGSPILDWVHPDDRPAAERAFHDLLARPGETPCPDLRVRHGDGSWRWVATNATNLLADPDIRGLVIHFRDITEAKLAEAALRQSAESFASLFESGGDGLMIHSGGTILAINGACAALLGYTPDDLIGRDGFAFVTPATVKSGRDGRREDGIPFEAEAIRRDGTILPVELVARAIRYEGKDARLVFVRDIGARKAAEAALRRSEASLAEAERIAHLGSWEYTIATGELRWSDEVFRIGGYPPQAFVPTPERMLATVHPADRWLLRAVLATPARTAGPYDLEHRVVRPDGEVRVVHQHGEVSFDAHGEPLKRLGFVQDITERKALEAQLQHQTFHSALTGLPNRALFMDRLGQALDRARRDARPCAILLLDLDRFKTINDSLGHAVGDCLLVAVAERLRGCLPGTDTLAHLGGDEFAVLLERIADVGEALRLAECLHAALETPLCVDGRDIHVSISIGLAMRTGDEETATDLLRFADVALYRAKGAGGAGSQIFYPGMNAQALERLDLERDLRGAVERDELRLHYQPLVELATGRIAGLEALVRWQHPARGLVPPGAFIPLAEETGLIVPIGRWVLRTACRQLRCWRARYPKATAPFMAVNLSPRQFRQPQLARDVADALTEAGLAPGALLLEITESVAMERAEETIDTLSALRALGVRLAIDDFGTGHSSLAYLHRLPVDALKIDRSFFRDAAPNRAIVRAVAMLARGLDLDVTAEGLETPEQVAWAREVGCDRGQGYYFAPPRPADAIEALWASGLVFDLPSEVAHPSKRGRRANTGCATEDAPARGRNGSQTCPVPVNNGSAVASPRGRV